MAEAEQRNAHLANAVLANGSDNRVVVVKLRVRTLLRSLMYVGIDVVRTLYISTHDQWQTCLVPGEK